MESSRGSLSILSRLSALKTQAPPLPLRCAEGLVVIWGCWGHWGGTVVPFAGATEATEATEATGSAALASLRANSVPSCLSCSSCSGSVAALALQRAVNAARITTGGSPPAPG